MGQHELVVSGEGGQTVHTIVQVAVADVNNNPPVFTNPDPHVTVIEEDDRHLPTTLIKVGNYVNYYFNVLNWYMGDLSKNTLGDFNKNKLGDLR